MRLTHILQVQHKMVSCVHLATHATYVQYLRVHDDVICVELVTLNCSDSELKNAREQVQYVP